MKKITTFSLLVLGFCISGFGQTKKITGVITGSDDNQTVPGVIVTVKGNNSIVTQTDLNGEYAIEVPAESLALSFSLMGYIKQDITIGEKTKINVVMNPKVLDDVVIMGYVVQSKKDVTSAVSTIKGESIRDFAVQSFDQALAGKATGVNITIPNGVLNNAPVIRVRGFNSISNSSYPLIILDGVPIFTGDRSGNSAANNPLGDINPSDIETMDILKDAAATAQYGSRAANGVMVITTKKGKLGKAKVNYNSWVGITKVFNMPEVLNANQYMEIKNEARRNANLTDAYFPMYNADGSLIDTHWADQVYQTGVSTNNDINLSGATKETSYYLSLGYSNQNGFIKKNDFERTSARFNMDHQLVKRIKIGTNISLTSSHNSAPNTGSLPGEGFASGGLGRLAFLTAPNIHPKNPDGTYNITNTNGVGLGNNLPLAGVQTGIYNPVFILDKNKFSSASFHLISSIYSEIDIFKWLKFKTTYMIDKNDIENQSYLSPLHGDGFTNQGTANNSVAKLIKTGLTNTLNFQKSFKETHNVFALVGAEQLYSKTDGWGGSRQKVADDFFQNYQGNYITNNPPVGNFQGENIFQSYFSWLSYDYNKKYFFTASIRRDGYSGLAKGNKFGNFYGSSVGWSLSEENFYKNSSLNQYINSVKLRSSYGKVGNMGIPDYGSLALYNSALYGDINTITYAQAGNSTLQWETSTKFDVGMVLGFLKDRIQFEVSYFKNNIDGLVLNAPQAPSKGIPGNSILINVGSMYNKGIELSINSTNINSKNFNWTTNVNFSFIDNKVTELSNGNADIVASTSGLERTNITRVGFSVGSIYAVRTAGVNPENGQRIFLDAASRQVQYSHIVPAGKSRWTYLDGTTAPAITSADAVVVGNAIPKWYGGFNNTIKFRDLIDLNIGLTFSGGNYVYNGSKAGMRDQRYWNNSTDVMDRWTYQGQSTDVPRVVYGDNVSNGSTFPISENVEKADFLKVRNISLGYTFRQICFEKIGISSLRLYVQAANILTITKYTGSDPEVSTNGNSNTTPGVDRNSVPQSQTFTFGLNLSL